MKPNRQSQEEERLNSLLREWGVETELPPGFEDGVWQRIERLETSRSPSLWDSALNWIEGVLPRPKMAFSYLAILLVAGVTAGSVAAQVKTHTLNATLSQRYVQSIDPYRVEIPQR